MDKRFFRFQVIGFLICSLLFLNAQSLAEPIHKLKGMSMDSETLTKKYANLFTGDWKYSNKKTYRTPRIELESLGTMTVIPGLELVRVFNDPPPPADPMPYDLWIVAAGKSVFKTDEACKAWLELKTKLTNKEDAILISQAIVYMKTAAPYYYENIVGLNENYDRKHLGKDLSAHKPAAELYENLWTVRITTVPFSMRSDFNVPSIYKKYSLRIAQNICEFIGK